MTAVQNGEVSEIEGTYFYIKQKDFEDNYELCFKEPKELVKYFNTLEENNLKPILENQEE